MFGVSFLKEKSNLAVNELGLTKDLKAKYAIKGKFIYCDNVGKNKAMEWLCKKMGLAISFRYTMVNTPQQNGCIKCKFTNLFWRFHSMPRKGTLIFLEKTSLDWDNKYYDKLENTVMKVSTGWSAFEQCLGMDENKIILFSLQKFIDLHIITNQKKIKAKLNYCAKPCIWSGYAGNHGVDTYHVLNPKTWKVIYSWCGMLKEFIIFIDEIETNENKFEAIDSKDVNSDNLSEEDQKLYQLVACMLLYLVNHSHSNIANFVRELSKVLDGAYLWDSRKCYAYSSLSWILLKFEPNLNKSALWNLVCYSIIDYAGDLSWRRSVSGHILYIRNVAVSCNIKAQWIVTLSSSEAEFVMLSDAWKKLCLSINF